MSEGTILIVDDEQMIRELLVDILTAAGNYRLLTAANGEEALTVFTNQEVDLVLTDLRMPGVTGLELLAELRRIKEDVPVIILTGHGRREDVIEALRLGASNFLMKPQEIKLVHKVASKVLRVRLKERLEQQIYEYFHSETQTYQIPNILKFTFPLIDLVTDKLIRVGICSNHDLTNIRLALDEALINAIIHGNLEIPSTMKGTSLSEITQFNQLVKERSMAEPYTSRNVHLEMELSQEQVKYVIQDEGNGFDWSQMPKSFEDHEILANHGRGLLLIQAFMDDVTFNDKGNCITLIKKRAPVNSEVAVSS
ncbi:MAG: response regulator [Candidatus Hinthialibacter antarcticus]|nr:response regulator [Candidatus Hinthialibacter antarcticus]